MFGNKPDPHLNINAQGQLTQPIPRVNEGKIPGPTTKLQSAAEVTLRRP